MKTPKEILDKIIDDSSWVLSENLIEEIIYPSMIEYGKQQYNKAVLDCADNATTDELSTKHEPRLRTTKNLANFELNNNQNEYQ